MKIHIKKGDIVKVIAGDSKGTQGKVLSVDREKYRAIVEGANMVSKHTKPNAKSPQGGIIKKEASIHISNLNVVGKDGKPSRVGRKEVNGKLVRYAKKTGEELK
jgi:large subunit ribosomal protein L24